MSKARTYLQMEGPIMAGLRAAIKESGMTAYSLGKESGVAQQIIARFLSGERDLKGATIDRLASSLKLRLLTEARGRGRPAKTSPQ